MKEHELNLKKKQFLENSPYALINQSKKITRVAIYTLKAMARKITN